MATHEQRGERLKKLGDRVPPCPVTDTSTSPPPPAPVTHMPRQPPPTTSFAC
ncbi:hypothetical protein LguiA_017063 [Lonicera macranthoides]